MNLASNEVYGHAKGAGVGELVEKAKLNLDSCASTKQDAIDEIFTVSKPIARPDSEDVDIPGEVKRFLMNLIYDVYDRDIERLKQLYEVDFNMLTERYYSKSRWPSLEEVKVLYENRESYHKLIHVLYGELYFRHIFAKCPNQLKWEDRVNSWYNYEQLFSYLIEYECIERESQSEGLVLPTDWIWGTLDEFVYQFHDTSKWRMRIAQNTEDSDSVDKYSDISSDYSVWKCDTVLHLLHMIVEKTGIKGWLDQLKEDSTRSNSVNLNIPQGKGFNIQLSDVPLRYQLGYFAMICLLRLHVLLADYHHALEIISDLELSNLHRSVFWKVASCHVTTVYNMGFSYMMLHRYVDAMRVFQQSLLFLNKSGNYLTPHAYQHEAMMKNSDRIYWLVILSQALLNGCGNTYYHLEDSIIQTLKDKFPDKYYKLQQIDDEEMFAEIFLKAAPRFILPFTPINSSDELKKIDQNEPQQRQLDLLLQEVRQQKLIANIRSFTKLYNNIRLDKLVSLMEIDEADNQDAARCQLMRVKTIGRQYVWKSGNLLSGEIATSYQDVDFLIEKDMIHILSSKQQKCYVDYFFKQLVKSQNVLVNIQQLAMNSAVAEKKQVRQKQKAALPPAGISVNEN